MKPWSVESGTWSDWTLSVELDSRFKHYFTATFPQGVDYPFAPETNPYILDDIAVINDPSAPHGGHSLRLTTGGGSTGHHAEHRSFVGPDQQTYMFLDHHYRVSLSRDLYLESGSSLSLYADFYTEDYQDDQAVSSASFDYLVIIPEPTTVTLIGFGVLALVAARRRN